tara:strand:+ start:440 stop:595 length:156 start_codon:yes stop_codon:yes gene_type:complete
MHYHIIVSGDGTEAQFLALERKAVEYSPNIMTVATEVPSDGKLVIAKMKAA